MNNPFENKTDEELKVLFKQYIQFQKTGVIPDNELGKIRDDIIKKLGSGAWQILMMEYLLEAIGNKWLDEA